jgi:hypothetical protein
MSRIHILAPKNSLFTNTPYNYNKDINCINTPKAPCVLLEIAFVFYLYRLRMEVIPTSDTIWSRLSVSSSKGCIVRHSTK